MKKYLLIVATTFLVVTAFYGCEPSNDEENLCAAAPTDTSHVYVEIWKFGKILSGIDSTPTAFTMINKTDLDPISPVLTINNRNIPLIDDSLTACQLGGYYFHEAVPNIAQSTDFKFGQVNNIVLNSRTSGVVNHTFRIPNETKMTVPADNIIHKNQNLLISFTGASDFPIAAPTGASYSETIRVHITYQRSLSDVVTYPDLPSQNVQYGTSWNPAAGQFIIPSTELQRFPLNGTVLLEFYRESGFTEPIKNKVITHTTVTQWQNDRFVIKN